MATRSQTGLTILRRTEVSRRTGKGRSAIYAAMKPNPKRPNDYDPTFPKPISIGPRSVGWIEAEVEAWINAQIHKSRTVRGAAMDKKNPVGVAIAQAGCPSDADGSNAPTSDRSSARLDVGESCRVKGQSKCDGRRGRQ